MRCTIVWWAPLEGGSRPHHKPWGLPAVLCRACCCAGDGSCECSDGCAPATHHILRAPCEGISGYRYARGMPCCMTASRPPVAFSGLYTSRSTAGGGRCAMSLLIHRCIFVPFRVTNMFFHTLTNRQHGAPTAPYERAARTRQHHCGRPALRGHAGTTHGLAGCIAPTG